MKLSGLTTLQCNYYPIHTKVSYGITSKSFVQEQWQIPKQNR